MKRVYTWPLLVLPLSGFGCGSLDDASDMPSAALGGSPAEDDGRANAPAGAIAPTANAGAPTTPGAAAPLPPELELELEFELPQAGERYVYAANPENDSVAVIDATTLAIQSVEAGDQPTFLQTLAGTDAAVVLNVGSNDATIVRTNRGASTVETVPVQRGANAIAVSPDGRHAVVYFDARHRGAGATGSYQDISVLFLEAGAARSVAMTVGFRPSSVTYSADGAQAFVVTEDGVSILNFAEIVRRGAHIARTVALGNDAVASLDVSITPDGAYALARREGEGQLRLADLDSGEVLLLDLASVWSSAAVPVETAPAAPVPIEPESSAPVPSEPEPIIGDAGVAAEAGAPELPAPEPPAPTATSTPTEPPPAPTEPPPAPPAPPAAITDVDLAPSGAYALAVVRDRSAVLQVPIPGAFTRGEALRVMEIGNELIGSVSIAPDSVRALLYTTAVDTAERIALLDVASGEFDVIRLPKAVERVNIAPDSETALIVHKKLPGNPDEVGITPDEVIDRSYGYSVLEFDSGFSKLQITRAPVGPSTVVPGNSDLFVLFNDKNLGLREVHQIALQSFLVSTLELGSPPTSIGAVPGSQKVFVGQEHRDGRITFIDWETGALESVTGFELNSRIRE